MRTVQLIECKRVGGCISIHKWMDHFFNLLREKDMLASIHRHLLIFDGHKVHLILDMLTKAKKNEIDIFTIPTHTSHGLQPLDVACFEPFKQAWSINIHGSKIFFKKRSSLLGVFSTQASFNK